MARVSDLLWEQDWPPSGCTLLSGSNTTLLSVLCLFLCDLCH